MVHFLLSKHIPRIVGSLLRGLCLVPFAFGVAQTVGPTAEEDYRSGRGSDPVADLQARIEAGTAKLAYEPNQGFLRSVLRELKVPASSQMLVFSKTSLQTAFISSRTPRAIYFNDQVYVGWIKNAPNIEIASIDPKRGPMFYTLANEPGPRASFARQTDECLQCHEGMMTKHVPGLAFRSVYAGADGMPRLASGSFVTSYTSPFKERWGGWYVTGTHGSQRHMGNAFATGDERNSVLNLDSGANVTSLRPKFDVGSMLTPHSDIVALMVAEHQMEIQNLITKAGFLTRNALRDEAIFAPKGLLPGTHLDSTDSRIDHACEPLIKAMLCIDEPKLTALVTGTSSFAADYGASAPKDGQGRSLSQLDLKTRLLRYPCSAMIYSAAFKGLPADARAQIYHRLAEVLTGKGGTPGYTQLAAEDCQAVREILGDTIPEFARVAATGT